MSYDPNDLIMGAGGKSAAFPTIGSVVKGQILQMEVTQARVYGTGEPKTWPSGDPMMQPVFTLQTDERDPEDDDDDGVRRLFIDSKSKREAMREAIVAAGASRAEVGGTVAMQWASVDPQSKNKDNPRKLYVAQYRAPAVGVNDLISPPAGNGNGMAPTPAPQPVVATSLI